MSSPPHTSSLDPFNTRRPEVYQLTGWRRGLAALAGVALRLYYRSLRIRVSPQDQQLLRSVPPPRLLVVWHNRSLVMPEVFRRWFIPPKLACLISASRMAAWEADFFTSMKLRVVRGSTTRRSIPALREMIRELRAGHDVGISPDGPSGPLYSFRHGAVALARKQQVPLLLIAANTSAAYRTRTWDRHLIPLPFARVDLRLRCYQPDDALWNLSDPAAASQLRADYLELTRDPFQPPPHVQGRPH